MIIAILSDIHDHLDNLFKVLPEIKSTQAIIYCGDFCAPFVAPHLTATGLPVHAVLGNNDEDHYAIYDRASAKGEFHLTPLSQEFAELKIDGNKLAFCHYPKLGELLAKTGDYSAVFYGHTHVVHQETYASTLLLNPGSVCGIKSGQPGQASYALYDTTTNTAKIINITS